MSMKKITRYLVILLILGSLVTILELHRAVNAGSVLGAEEDGILIYEVGFFWINYQKNDSDVFGLIPNGVLLPLVLLFVNYVTIGIRSLIHKKTVS